MLIPKAEMVEIGAVCRFGPPPPVVFYVSEEVPAGFMPALCLTASFAQSSVQVPTRGRSNQARSQEAEACCRITASLSSEAEAQHPFTHFLCVD